MTGSLSNGDSLSASLGETNSINFDPTDSLTITLSQASSGDRTAIIGMRFSEMAAVPEPSSAALVGVGLAASGLVRWRKRRAGAPKTG
ncbi:MAG TPA: PEP-CTERM sorting domain-containing protein [Roseiarcus sp.]|nr:PEP-CTERM sorting domain-containing protein [Roseiarcus sp.]